MRLAQIRWRIAVAGALGLEVTLVACAFGWVAIYSYLIHPGEPAEFYQRYALGASPWVSVIAGIPIFFLACRWIRTRLANNAMATAVGLFGVYLLLEAPFVLLGENPLMPAWLPYLGYAGKSVAGYFGVKPGERAVSNPREV